MVEIGKTLVEFPPLVEGILIKRYKRFLEEIKLDNGQIITAHCANTGPMKGILNPGGKVRLRYAPSPTRKLKWSWEQAEVVNDLGFSCWVGINTALPNTLIKLAIENGCLQEEIGPIGLIRREVKYGINNRGLGPIWPTGALDSVPALDESSAKKRPSKRRKGCKRANGALPGEHCRCTCGAFTDAGQSTG